MGESDMRRKLQALALGTAAALLAASGCGCAPQAGEQPAASAGQSVTLTVAGPWEELPALEKLSARFSRENPGCRVVYEYVQNYYDALETRLAQPNSGVDLFVTTNLQNGSPLQPYALELNARSDALDLSGAFGGLIQNFTCATEDKGAAPQLYAVPLGAEVRGLYVNKTLLAKFGIPVPRNREELLDACGVLAQAGYVPFQGNPGNFGQLLMYPCVCNSIANAKDYQAVYRRVNSREAGVSELFRSQMEFVYTLAEKGYYNYKYIEKTYGYFSDGGNERIARNFLNIAGENGSYRKVDDVGIAAFMPGPMSLDTSISRMKDDYHSGIDYTFILAPTGDEGGYAYLSPADGIAVSKSSPQIEWALRYLNFLFTPANNKQFAEDDHLIPNTADALDQISQKFAVPQDRISQVGSVTFDYPFYSVIRDTLIEISKANNPKYMIDGGNGTYTMHSLDEYMQKMEDRFQQK
jgi:ABC-type glycerol-3-phosphate transport system substrate-binding protein